MSQPLPLSAKELDELRDVASYEAKGVRVRALVLSMRRLLATIEARDEQKALLNGIINDKVCENAALEAKLANIRKLCDENGCCCDCGRATIHRHDILAILDDGPGVEET